MNEKSLNMADFAYNLSNEKIALKPLEKRNDSQLLVYNCHTEKISDKTFKDLPDLLPQNSIMIINDSKVIYARLLFKNKNNATIEIFCIEPVFPSSEIASILQSKDKCTWKCMVGNLKKWKEEELKISSEKFELTVRRSETKSENGILIEFTWDGNVTFGEVLLVAGNVPLPPYIKRSAEADDKISYQTVYANREGSVAAPTAGLHFTNEELEKIQQKNIAICRLDLNVSAGTFLPVKTDNALEHKMHEEKFYIEKSFVEQLIRNSGKFICVGTTSMRAIESLYWIGCKMTIKNDLTINNLDQWEYNELEESSELSLKSSFEKILSSFEYQNKSVIEFVTSIMITPGYEFKVTDILITNFHQPKSTLLLLISAFTKGNWKKIYEHALNNNYRFLSYGDSSVLFKS